MRDNRINLIFDFDGTLVNSYDAVVDAFCRLFQRYGVTCDPADIRTRALMGSTKDTLKYIAEQNGLDAALLTKEFSSRVEDKALMSLYPHVREVLADPRFRCFVYTHRGQSSIDILGYFGVADLFEEIVNNTYHLPRKPDGAGVSFLVEKYGLDKSKTYYVGDRKLDIECGINAGCGAIFFQSSGLDIDCSAANCVVTDLGDIPKVLFKE